ncbi:MAG TPA: hypothetical protein VED37_17045 [Ktedonobacteraceae bacterium]|nr:hypothetical protein [Ktedonobacteraceae bacterium]
MPKTYKRRKMPARTSSDHSRATGTQTRSSGKKTVKTASMSNATTRNTSTAISNRSFFSPRVAGPQSLIFPGMIAAGCWLMAYTLIFLTNDTNRYILGVMAVLMALLWTFSFGVRVRKLLLMRQRPRS